MPLSSEQQLAVRILDWLLDTSEENRRTGRSLAMSVSLIRQALRHPGNWIGYIDHLPVAATARFIRSTIEDLVVHDPFLGVMNWSFRARDFRLVQIPDQTIAINATVPWPIWNWLPTLEGDPSGLHPVVMPSELAAETNELLHPVEEPEPEAEVERPSVWEVLAADD